MQPGLIRALLPYAVLVAVAASSTWWVRGLVADKYIAAVHAEYAQQETARQLAKSVVEQLNKTNTEKSTERVDAIEQQRQVDIRYVDREVIKYVASKPQSCPLPPEWVCLANAALGVPCRTTEAGR